MAFKGMVITYDGQSLLTQTQISKQFTIKYVRIGDGKYNADHHDIHNMVNPLYDVIPEIQHKDNQLLIEADITSNDHSGYYLREIGIIATDASGQEVLYAYDNAGNDAEYINPVDSGIAYEKRLRFALSITDDITINIQINGSVYALQRDLVQHVNDKANPHNVTVEQLGLDKVDNTADKDKPISDATKKALDGKEPVFSKNSAFNKNFGNAAGTVCQGNDSRLNDARTPKAHNHNDLYHTKAETDQAMSEVGNRVTRLETNGVSVADTLPVGSEFYYEGDISLLPDNVEIIEPPFSNPNLLINEAFRIWQRGTEFNDVATGLYVADRWITNKGNSSILNINKHEDGLKIYADNVAGIFQYVPIKKSKILGKSFTLTFCIDNTAYTFNFTVENVGTVYTKEIGMNESTINNYYDETRSCFIVSVFLKDGKEHVINYAKLEYGEIATPYVSRLYAEELMLCQRYYQAYSQLAISASYRDGKCHYFSYPLNICMRTSATVIISNDTYMTNKKNEMLYSDPLNDIDLKCVDGKSITIIKLSALDTESVIRINSFINIDAEIY